ncbi:hypothetical protein GCM10022216_35320 [Sphingobacterium kyonggiense]|uniref:Uncharacterized protein n=1 Tax=Sphingobacterium kyonggiense TaxID=714075 RepID=A0ABP7Z6Q2_9SPHI
MIRQGFHIAILSFFTFLYSCNHQNNSNRGNEVYSVSYKKDSLISKTEASQKMDDSVTDSTKLIQDLEKEAESQQGIIVSNKAIIPGAQRYMDQNDKTSKMVNSDWLSIYLENDQYKLGKQDLAVKEKGEDPCSGMDVEYIDTKISSLLLVNIKNLAPHKLDTLALKDRVIQPNRPLKFQWKNQNYELVATGRTFTEAYERSNEWYTLTVYKNGIKLRTLIIQNDYNDTQTSILLISDLDNDQIPDFIISSPRDYEEERILIFISSDPKIYEAQRVFDC